MTYKISDTLSIDINEDKISFKYKGLSYYTMTALEFETVIAIWQAERNN